MHEKRARLLKKKMKYRKSWRLRRLHGSNNASVAPTLPFAMKLLIQYFIEI